MKGTTTGGFELFGLINSKKEKRKKLAKPLLRGEFCAEKTWGGASRSIKKVAAYLLISSSRAGEKGCQAKEAGRLPGSEVLIYAPGKSGGREVA